MIAAAITTARTPRIPNNTTGIPPSSSAGSVSGSVAASVGAVVSG